MPKKQKQEQNSVTYHFVTGVTIDARDDYPERSFKGDSAPDKNDGEEVRAEDLPPHIDLQTLVSIGAVRPVEDK